MHIPRKIVVRPSHEVRDRLGRGLRRVGRAALEALLADGRSFAVAHRQIVHDGHCLAFSSRIGSFGDLVVEVDLGDPKLADRIVYENELREAAELARQARGRPRRAWCKRPGGNARRG